MALIANINTLADNLISSMEAKGAFDDKDGFVDTTRRSEVRTDIIDSWTIILQFLIDNVTVSTTLDSSLNTIFTSGTAVANDGGGNLKSAWSTVTLGGAKDGATGGIS